MKFYFFLIISIFYSFSLVTALVNIGEENTLARGVNIVEPTPTITQITDTNATTACTGGQVLFGNGSCGIVAADGGPAQNPFNQDLNTTNNVIFNNVTISDSLEVNNKATFDIGTNLFFNLTLSNGANFTIFNNSGGILLTVDNSNISSITWLPLINNTYDLGSPNLGWKDFYIAGTIFGASPIKINDSIKIVGADNINLTINGTHLISTSGFIIVDNITGEDFNGETITSSGNLTVGTNITVGDTVTANFFIGLFSWIVDLFDGSTSYLTFNQSTLSFNETKLNSTIEDTIDEITSGNFTENIIYSSMFNRNSSGVEITIDTTGIFSNVTSLQQGESNGFTFANNTLTSEFDGIYLLFFVQSHLVKHLLLQLLEEQSL